jgi:F420-dependent oxidoreductase-like protein
MLDIQTRKKAESGMTQQDTTHSFLRASDIARKSLRARVGLAIQSADAAVTVSRIREAEQAGVQQVWMTQSAGTLDTLTIFAVAATQTGHIRLGTSIVPTYPRHPMVMAQQAATIDALAPGRLRLGIGPSHRHIMVDMYGLSMPSPLEYLGEYVEVLRQGLWDGRVEHSGRFFTVKASLPRAAQVPLLVSALGEKAFRLAGEISDGAISWVTPVPYLLNTALPALRSGAEARNRPTPPLVAHIPVAMSSDDAAVQAAATPRLSSYTKAPFYAHMFEAAGFPVPPDGSGLPAIVRELVVTGDQAQVVQRLRDLLASGLDELLLMLIPVKDETREREALLRVIGEMED